MAKRNKKLYAEIAKTEQQEDGTVKVWGYASTGAEDSDGETITPDCMKAALPDYMTWGAVREMHDATKAAGTAIEAAVQDDGKTFFGAHVVDPVAVQKVNAGVYKGFSIGGKVTERDTLNKSVIKGIKLYEVSLVDRPANPEATFTLVKAQRTDDDELDEVAALLDDGAVTPAELAKAARELSLAKSTAETQDQANKEKATELPVEKGANATANGGSTKQPNMDANHAVGADPMANTAVQASQHEASDSSDPTGKDKSKPKDATESGTKSATVGSLRKGMYSVSNFASLLQSLAYLCSDAEWEADMEEDGSTVPAALSDWIAAGAEVFRSMAVEEVNELVACLGGAAAKATKKGDLAKVASTNSEDPIAKALAPLNEQLATLQKTVESLQVKNEELSKRAAPGKALLKAIAVNKEADSKTEVVEKAETPPPEGTMERANFEMKKALSAGQILR